MTIALRPVSVQLVLAAMMLTIVGVTPPAKGAILIVSLDGQSAGAIADWAMVGDARVLGRGPIAGSLMVNATRSTLAGAAWRHRSLLLNGGAAGCSGGATA